MPSRLESPEAVDDYLEAHLARHSGRTSAIYWMVLLLICAALASTLVIRVGVAVEARGVIRPALDRHEVVAGTTGMVGEVLARENQVVAAGDPLIVIVTESIESRLQSLSTRLEQTEAALRDLTRVSKAGEEGIEMYPGLETPLVREEFRLYREQLAAIETRVASLERELERASQLHALGLLSTAEVEQRRMTLNGALAEKTALHARQRGEWQARLASLQHTHLDLLDQRTVLSADSAMHTIRAPVTGTVEQLLELSPGSFVRTGQTVAIISPAAPLVAEVFVPTSRFGMIQQDMPVRLLIDAYDYIDWGYIPGRVAELPDDNVVIDDIPLFRTIVEMETTGLTLASGIRREVSKGMTLSARFMVSERTLWNLIRDDINDWFNPSQPPE